MQNPTLYVFNRRGPLVHHLRSDVLRPPSVNGPWTSKKSCRFVTSEIGTVRNEDGASAVMASGRTGCGIRDANMRSTSRETVWVFARTVDKLRSAYRHCNDDRAVHTLEQTCLLCLALFRRPRKHVERVLAESETGVLDQDQRRSNQRQLCAKQ